MTSAPLADGLPVRVRDLGLVAIQRAGDDEAVLSGKAALVVSLLASRYPKPVSRQTFFDVLWADESIDRSNGLRVLIHRVRQLLGSVDLLPYSDESYRLAVAPTQLDSTTFAMLVESAGNHLADAQASAAKNCLDEALSLWSGPVAGGQAMPNLRTWQTYLETMRLDAEETRVQALLATGEAAAAAADARKLADNQPYRERRWELLMLALYRSGRQQEALAAASEATARLREELGVNPGSSLRQLEFDILEQATRLDLDPSHQRTMPLLPALAGGPLLGRSDELALVHAELDDNRVVSITGPGGIGKTAVALQLAHELTHGGTEVWWCDLAGVATGNGRTTAVGDFDRSEVARRVGLAAGVSSGSDSAADIAQILSHRAAVTLVLDNCEHVIEAVRGLVDTLCGALNVTILTTSRRPLDLPAECLVQLGSLDGSAAVQLFQRVARAAAPTAAPFDLTLIAKVCERLGGMPLAIELAARRVRSFSLREIDTHLHALLYDGGPPVSQGERHATISSALNWSIDLLSPSGRRAAGIVSVFRGSFELTAFEALVAPGVDDPPLLVLEELVDHGLVQVIRGEDHSRYHMLQPIREYAAAHLVDDESATRDRHLEHYLDRLEAAYDAQQSSGSRPLSDVIRHEMDNLALLHDWALQTGRLDDDARLYRPLMLAHLHDRPEPFLWATEAAQHSGMVECDRYGDVLHAAWYGAVAVQLDLEAALLIVPALAAIPRSSKSHDLATLALGLHALLVEHDYDQAEARLAGLASLDPYVRYVVASVGASVRLTEAIRHGRDQVDAVAAATSSIENELRWARSVNAANIEAALLERLAQVKLDAGLVVESRQLATEAQVLAAAQGMGHVHAQAQFQLVRCDVAEGWNGPDVARRLADALQQAVHASAQARLRWQLPVAAEVLLLHGLRDVAAVCLVSSGFAASSDRVADALADEELAAATELARERSLLDIAALAVRRLQTIDTPTTT